MTEPLDTEDANAENMELRPYESSEEAVERGGDEERGDSDNPLTEQNGVSDDVPEDREEARRCTCNCEFVCLILPLVLMTVDQVMDGLSFYNFYIGGHIVFFVLNLVFVVGPSLCIHLVATVALELSWWKALLCFPVAPWVLLVKVICIHIRGTKEQEKIKRTSKNMSVCEGYFEAVPQLFIQMTALKIGIFKDSRVISSCVKMVFSCVTASFALLSVFRKQMHWLLQGVSVVLVAMVLGSRVFVCASLFSLEGPLLCTGFLPLALSFFLAWVTDYVFKREKVSTLRAYIKATLLPPEDKAGGMASLVYCAFGLVFWLLTISQPLSVLVFVGVTVIHILGGIGWMILTQNGHKSCKGKGKKGSCLP
ncbi:uncharacterized protein LOC134765564 [Penaeus indicus]|uniref:uncharacterized protein LOC134765564 n=1 Tax=Penaeus indicus TaxID=29960 RepID=UPI00300C6955